MTDDASAFVDTNVLVYAFDQGEETKQRAASNLIETLASERRIVLSTQILQEFFVTVTRKIATPIAPADAIQILESFEPWNPRIIEMDDIKQAAQLSDEAHLSFWDALVVVSASHAGAEVLYSEDLSHGQEILGVLVVNPFRKPASRVHDG